MSTRHLERIFGQPLYITAQAALALARTVAESPIADGIRASVPRRPTVDRYGDEIPQMEIKNGIAYVPISGSIIKGATGFDKWAFGMCSPDDVSEDLEAAVAEKVDQIMLLMSSPGGTVTGCRELGSMVIDLSSHRLLTSWNETMCCSAAEFISAGARVRGATPSSLNGSIGTRMEVWDFSRMLDRAGVDVKVFASGKFKAAGHPAKALTDEQAEYFEGFVTRLGAEFQTHMATQRPKLKLEQMQGQVFTGSEARDIGLVDTLANSRPDFVRQVFGK